MRTIHRTLVSLSLAALLSGVAAAQTPPSAAQTKQATAHFNLGKAHLAKGNHDEALAEFKAAYAILPLDNLQFYFGQVARLKGEKQKAIEYYQAYIAAKPDGKASDEARQHIASLTRAIKAEAEKRGPAKACDSLETCRTACDLRNLEGCAELLAIHTRACDGGDAGGCDAAARLHADGVSLPRNEVQAAILWEKACNLGKAEICMAIGVRYFEGRVVVRDEGRAAMFLDRACVGNLAQACHRQGLLLRDGTTIQRNDTRATVLFERACSLGSMAGCVDGGHQHRLGRGVPRDEKRAVALYEKPCASGEAIACGELGALLANRQSPLANRDRAVSLLQKSCDGGYKAACASLGNLVVSEAQTESDLQQGMQLLQRACDDGRGPGCAALHGAGDTLRQFAEAKARHGEANAERHRRFVNRIVGGTILFVIGAGLAGGGVGLYSKAEEQYNQLQAECGGRCPQERQEDVDSGRTNQLIGNILTPAGGTLGGIGLIVLLSSIAYRGDEPAPRLTPAPGATPSGLSFGF